MAHHSRYIGITILLGMLFIGTSCGGSASSSATVLTDDEQTVLQDTITVLTAVVAIEGDTLSVDRADR